MSHKPKKAVKPITETRSTTFAESLPGPTPEAFALTDIAAINETNIERLQAVVSKFSAIRDRVCGFPSGDQGDMPYPLVNGSVENLRQQATRANDLIGKIEALAAQLGKL